MHIVGANEEKLWKKKVNEDERQRKRKMRKTHINEMIFWA
jgi:hypothetical protein